jgi:hypothetical protein
MTTTSKPNRHHMLRDLETFQACRDAWDGIAQNLRNQLDEVGLKQGRYSIAFQILVDELDRANRTSAEYHDSVEDVTQRMAEAGFEVVL